ncbi:MAG TPA: transposase [Syntrophales bacterium]|nr:transposase [Syntrophales bacterium]
MDSTFHNQSLLFSPEDISKKHLQKYDLLLSNINVSPLKNHHQTKGRSPTPKDAILASLIYKTIRCIPTLSDLLRELNEHPNLAYKLGFIPSRQIPSVERLSSFLRDTPNDTLQSIREDLVRKLIAAGEISGKFVSTDSCPIAANVKENNLKTVVKERFDKTKITKGDPDARLGVFVTFPSESQKKISFFWGYKNHVVTDAVSELPISEITRPANIHDSNLIIPQLTYLKNTFPLSMEAVIADSAFDSAPIIEFIVKELDAKPVIARNPRGNQNTNLKISFKGAPICIAGFEMLSRGVFYDKSQNRTRHKFICPITGSKKFAREVPICPWWHPKFLNGSGCITYLRVDENIRQSIDYGSETFKKLYKLRVSSERIFSRLLSLCMQTPSVTGLNAVRNHCTIAHISILAIALTAVRTDHRDKIRFVKTLFPNL